MNTATTMPTLSIAGRATSPGVLRRIINVARLHLVNRNAVILLPLFIMSIIFTSSMLILWIVTANVERVGEDGVIAMGNVSSFIVIYMLVVAVQAMNLTFPFAQGYSVTRRDFYLGSALAFVALSLFYATLMTVLATIETATNGWGVNGFMFGVGYLGVTGPVATFYVYLMALLFFFFVGMAVASMYVRWKNWGITGFFTGFGFLVIGLLALVTFTDSWPRVGTWFVTNGALGLATWSLVPTIIAAMTGFFILRRATPRG